MIQTSINELDNVITASLKGQPLPEPPAWHKACHPCMKG